MRTVLVTILLVVAGCGARADIVWRRQAGDPVTMTAGQDQERAWRRECTRQGRVVDLVRWSAGGAVGLSGAATFAAAAEQDQATAWLAAGMTAASFVALAVAEVMDSQRARLCELSRMDGDKGSSPPAAPQSVQQPGGLFD